MKIAKVRGQDLEMFYLGYSESGQRLHGYSIDKVQQSGRGEKEKRKAPHGSKEKKKKSRLQQRAVLIHPPVKRKQLKQLDKTICQEDRLSTFLEKMDGPFRYITYKGRKYFMK